MQSEDLIAYIKEELESRDKEMFLVVSKEIEEDQSWLLDQSRYSSKTNSIQERDAEIVKLGDIGCDGVNHIENNFL